MNNQPISIVIADDHPVVRQGFIRIIESDPGFQIIGECGNGTEVLDFLQQKMPDILVLDIAMPDLTGLEVVKQLGEAATQTRIVILTMYKDRAYFDEAMSLGIRGYLLKDNAVDELLTCLHAIRGGQPFIANELVDYLLTPKPPEVPPEIQELLDRLTPSEKSVLALLSENKTSKEIADDLFISYRTVQNHRYNMARKLDLEGHHKLLHFAMTHKKYLGNNQE